MRKPRCKTPYSAYLKAAKDGKIRTIETEEHLAKLLRRILRREVLDEREREDAGKRGGSGAKHDGGSLAVRHLGEDFDATTRMP